jgi:hypothetical protein
METDVENKREGKEARKKPYRQGVPNSHFPEIQGCRSKQLDHPPVFLGGVEKKNSSPLASHRRFVTYLADFLIQNGESGVDSYKIGFQKSLHVIENQTKEKYRI